MAGARSDEGGLTRDHRSDDQPSVSTTLAMIDGHRLFRQSLTEILKKVHDFQVVVDSEIESEALKHIEEYEPDVVLLDLETLGESAFSTVRQVRSIAPRSVVIILSMHDCPRIVRRLLQDGAAGYLLKSITYQELVSAIRSLRSDPGRAVLSVSRHSLVQTDPSDEPSAGRALLTERELETLALVSEALTNAQIAKRLGITVGTVKRHLKNVFAKLSATSRIDAVNRAAEHRLISPPRLRRPVAPGRRKAPVSCGLPGCVDTCQLSLEASSEASVPLPRPALPGGPTLPGGPAGPKPFRASHPSALPPGCPDRTGRATAPSGE